MTENRSPGLKLAAHQPNFIPWCGYFYKIALSDIFVIAGNVDYTRKGFINRNRIKTPGGSRWLTLAVEKFPLGTPVFEIKIFEPRITFKRVLDLVEHNYSRSEYFDLYYPDFRETLSGSGDRLADININLIKFVLRNLDIKTKIIISNETGGAGESATERIISLCKTHDALTYISGFGGKNYQEEEEMTRHGIECEIYDFRHPVYKQLWGLFEPSMSVIDLLFNCGPESYRIMMGRNI